MGKASSIHDFVDERHSNFYSNTLYFFLEHYGESLRIETFSGSRLFFLPSFLNGLGTRNQPRHHFFRSGCESDCYATFPSKPSLRMAHRSNFFATGRSQKCWEWTTQMIFLQRAEHPYFHTVDGSEIWRSPPAGYEALIHIIWINYQAQLTSRISEPSTCQGFSQCISYANPPKKDVFF